MHALALVLVTVAGIAVVSMMVWTIVGWARSDRERVERQERERDQNGSGG